MSTPPCAIEDFIPKLKYNFISSETFEIKSNNNKVYIFKISYNENIINFEIEEKNSFPKNMYSLTQNLSELIKIDKFFVLFEKTEEIFNSFKKLFSEKNLNLIEEDNIIKIKIFNSITNKYFFIVVPRKIKDLNDDINYLYKYINKLEEKINNLEKETKEIKIENNKLKEKNIEYSNKLKENTLRIEKLERMLNKNTIDNNDMSIYFKNSNIVKNDDINLILDWLEIKPKSFELLLDSKVDGDLTNTFYEKCGNKKPTITFIKSTEGFRFGGFTNETWPNYLFKSDPKSFIFSLDKKRKYKIIKKEKAIYFQNNYGFCFGENSIFIYNNSSSTGGNITEDLGVHDFPQKVNDLNNGKSTFKVSSYEVYQIKI